MLKHHIVSVEEVNREKTLDSLKKLLEKQYDKENDLSHKPAIRFIRETSLTSLRNKRFSLQFFCLEPKMSDA